jgi:hypothetical protein
MCVMLKAGTLVGIFAMVASRPLLNRFSLAVLAGAIIGAAAVIQVVGYDPNAMYRRTLHASISELFFGNEFGQQFLIMPAMIGAAFGSTTIIALLCITQILRSWRGRRNEHGKPEGNVQDQ